MNKKELLYYFDQFSGEFIVFTDKKGYNYELKWVKVMSTDADAPNTWQAFIDLMGVDEFNNIFEWDMHDGKDIPKLDDYIGDYFADGGYRHVAGFGGSSLRVLPKHISNKYVKQVDVSYHTQYEIDPDKLNEILDKLNKLGYSCEQTKDPWSSK